MPQLVTDSQPFDIATILADFNSQVENFRKRGSGYVLDRVIGFVLCVNVFRPLHGSSYLPTPNWLANKHCIINVQNQDQKCFVYSILSALYPAKINAQRLSNYVKYESMLNLQGRQFPMPTKLIPHFEKCNPSISINVLYPDADSRGFCVEYLSKHRDREHHINLIVLEDPQNPSKRHYAWIKNMSALVCHRTKTKSKTFVCNSCLHPFHSEEVLDRHVPECIQHNPQQVVFPNPNDEKDRTLKFRAKHKLFQVPCFLVCDFISPVERAEAEKSRGLTIVDEHKVSGFASYRITQHAKHEKKPFVYSGPDVMNKLYDYIMEEAREISLIVRGFVDMRPLTREEADEYDHTVTCGSCGGAFTKENRKVHHHCHVTGNYLFAACNNCNLQLKPRKSNPGKKKERKDAKRDYQSSKEWSEEKYLDNFFVPNVFHNLRFYDAHFVIKHFQRKFVENRNNDNELSFDDVHITPTNSEKYLQFQVGNLRFLGSFQFLSTSLDQLVQLLLKSGKEHFVHTSKYLGNNDAVFAKGVYPYSYMTSRDKFEEKQLPPIEAFYDKLKEEALKQEDYVRAQQTWSSYGMENMQQYHDHYLLTDVLLLSDVFDHFRQMVIREHNLDCLHFITLPSLAWAMALKHTKVELDLITDPEMYLFIENSMRGGIATISQRYASANNSYVDGHNRSEPNRYITYLDANSLYATAQSEPLPVGNFRFLDDDEIQNFDLATIEPDAEVGYIVECDLEYPAHLHDLHNDYPMAPEHLTVTR